MPALTLTKIDAATRQLNTAIEMWFAEDDVVSTHTLACAAYQLVHDVNASRGGPELIYDSICFKDEFRNKAVQHLRREYDFFRHADRIREATIDFDDTHTEPFLLFGCYGLEALGVTPDVVRGAMAIYYAVRNPAHLTAIGRERFVDSIPIDTIEAVKIAPRKQFFEAYKFLRK
jgi:hypothetical protein